MKYIAMLAIPLFLAAGLALADDAGRVNGSLKVLRKPIVMDYGASPLLSVTFNHSTHKNIKCIHCHHMESDSGARFVPCTIEECHSQKGARERDTMSMFMAYHAAPSDRSCYGCHKIEAPQHADFKGCQPCHITHPVRQPVAVK